MKRKITLLILGLFVSLTSIYTQTATPPSVGDGSEDNPYQITTLENLYWLSLSDTAWNKHFIQTTDIDATSTSSWYDGKGFLPIGNSKTSFSGTYNGKGYVVSNLTINRPNEDHIAFFGAVDCAVGGIDSLGLTNVNIEGRKYVGGMVGVMFNGVISNSYTTGFCTSNTSLEWWSRTGGLVGDSRGDINLCYSTVEVKSNKGWLGGLAGLNNNGNISNSYSGGSVNGGSYGRVGGLVGDNYGLIESCYSYAYVNVNDFAVGGLVGYEEGTVVHSFWDKEASGQTSSSGGTGLTTAEMKDARTYLREGWDFMDETENGETDIWGINETDNRGYPFLKWQGFTGDNVCQAPYEPAAGVIVAKTSTTTILLDTLIAEGYGIKGYVVFLNTSDAWTAPSDGDDPITNTTWQNAGQQCIYNGLSSDPNIVIDGLDLCGGSSNYYIKTYLYNICSDSKVYETTGLLKTIETDDIDSPIPNITNLPDIKAQCEINISEKPTATDMCAGTIEGTTINPLAYNIQGTYKITWTYDDGNGNISTQEQTVIVEDKIAPVPDESSLPEISDPCCVTISEVPTATDNCSGTITGITSDPLTYEEQGTYVITWIYTDAEGNTTTQEQTVIIIDETSPTIGYICDIQNMHVNIPEAKVIIQFSEPVSNFTKEVMVLTNATGSDFVELVENTKYEYTLTAQYDGSVHIEIPEESIFDMAGNSNEQISYFSYYYDGTRPSVSLTTMTGENAFAQAPIEFILNASELVAIGSSDLVVENGIITEFTNIDANTMYWGKIIPNNNGMVTVHLPENVIEDLAGNLNIESEYLVVYYDSIAPEILSHELIELGSNSAQVNITISEDGNVYTSLLADTVAELSAEQIMSDSIYPLLADTEWSLYYNNLEENTTYRLWSVLEDTLGNVSVPGFIQFRTLLNGVNSEIYENIDVYPNPNNGEFEIKIPKIKNKDKSLALFDVMGNVVLVQEIENEIIKVNISNYAKGVYLLQLNIDGTLLQKRIVKE